MTGFYDIDCPGIFRRCIELRADGTVSGGTREKFWRTTAVADAPGGAKITRLEILDDIHTILFQLSPDSGGWSTVWCGKPITMRPLPQQQEVKDYIHPSGGIEVGER